MGFGSGSNLGVVRLLHEVGEHAGGALGHAAEDLQVEVGVGGLRVLRVELARLVADELDAQPSEEGEHLVIDGVRVRTRVLGIDRGRVGVRVRVEVRVGVRVRVRDRVWARGVHLLGAAAADEAVLHVAPREAQVARGRDELAQKALLVRLLALDALAHLWLGFRG